MDPHHFGKPDPDPHQREMPDPDPIEVKIQELLRLKTEPWRAVVA